MADLGVEVHRAEIVPGFLKVDLRPVLGDVSVAARETHNSQEEGQDTSCFDVFDSTHEKGFSFIVFLCKSNWGNFQFQKILVICNEL